MLLPPAPGSSAPRWLYWKVIADRLHVDVVLEVAADVAVVVDVVPLEQDVAAGDRVRGEDEEAVAVVVHVAVAHSDVLAELDVDRRGWRRVASRSRRSGPVNVLGLSRPADLEVLDHEPLRHHVVPSANGTAELADLDDAAARGSVVELGARGGAVAVEDRPLAVRAEHAPDVTGALGVPTAASTNFSLYGVAR